jgi:LCP family protein required for cell wall assembly
VRTTLKRSSGRIAADANGNGNGRAAVPPMPPPVVPWGGRTRYPPPRRSWLKTFGKGFMWLTIVLLMAAGALGGGAWLFINQSVKAVRAHTPEAKAAQEVLDVPVPGAPTVAMVIGYDQRKGIEASDVSRSDTIMLVRANPDQEMISLLSFPRDLLVEIPACKGYAPRVGRINEAYAQCGLKGSLLTVKQLTGIPINYLVAVNFHGFKEIVNEVGGVYVDVDRRYFNNNSGSEPDYATINLQPGYQKLTGGAALDFVRFRHTDSDFYRTRRQQEFVKAFKQQVNGLWSVTKIPGVVNAITENVEVSAGGGKAIDVDTLYGYAKLAYELPAGNFFQVQIDPSRVSGYSELQTEQASIDDAVRQFMNPDPKAAKKATDVATRRKPREPRAPPPSETTIEVVNGNGVAGSADEAAFGLSQRGYSKVIVGGNAKSFDYFHTKVLYDPKVAGAKPAANVVAKLFGDGEVEAASPTSGIETMLLVVTGQTFTNRLGPGVIDKTEKYQPPQVVKNAAHARGPLRKAQQQVDFTVYLPTVIESSSYLDETVPVRAYRVNEEDAVRLVYTYGGRNEWWGIQQTSWTEAPILQGPSVTRWIKGRAYKLFFNGSKLHLVAFEENGAAYWVVNTILDKLTNETMLAIAKGLRPLGSPS